MTRKHFVLTAEMLALSRPCDAREYPQSSNHPLRFMRNQWLADREQVMRLFAANPRFDRERFIAATEA